VKLQEIVHKARLEGVYGSLRKTQAEHDAFETRCAGSGNCCKIGLFISLGECWNIAKNIKEEYFLVAEDKGFEEAEVWYNNKLAGLAAALYDREWDYETQETSKPCAFLNDHGCSIYRYRPMVCRAYGVIAPVQDGVCPRKRLPDGGHELIWDEAVERTMKEFDSIIEQWGKDFPQLDYSMHIAAGVLRFLLPNEELQSLIADTDPKFWMAHPGYGHQIKRENWQTVTIRSSRES
jgi:Fe-S-cluster containining protein